MIRCTDERAQKEEDSVKLNEQVIKLEGRVSTLLASKEHAKTKLMNVEKSMLEERDELLATRRNRGPMQRWRNNLTRVILLSMSTRSTILGEMWGEML